MPPPFARVARALLPSWEVSLAFVTPQKARDLNKKLRGKSYTPNVLSYQVGVRHAEVIICKTVAKKQAPLYDLLYPDFLLLLFIHACLHLKGGRHGSTMERRERSLLARFKSEPRTTTHGSSHHNGNRHRHLPSKGGGGRRASR